MNDLTAVRTAAPLVWFIPEQSGVMVTMHACWGADFAGETAVFPTEGEAVEFCRKHWRREPGTRGMT